MSDTITLDQLKRMITAESLKPETLFSDEQLKELRDAARAEGYAEARAVSLGEKLGPALKEAVLASRETDEGKGDDTLPAELDPARNPFIKTADDY